jgi:hypothetical protein
MNKSFQERDNVTFICVVCLKVGGQNAGYNPYMTKTKTALSRDAS